MQALKQDVYIEDNHQLRIDVPRYISTGKSEVFIVFQHVEKDEQHSKRVFGSAKGEIIVSDDFDEPLPDEILSGFYS